MREQDTKNIRSFTEELSSKLKKAAAPIKMKTRKEAESVSDCIRVEIVGQSKNMCRSAMGRLKNAVDENCFRRAYQGKIPTALDENKLKEISDRFEVTLAIDVVPGSDRCDNSPVIYVAGKKEEVLEALIGMGQMFTEMMERELDAVSAALVSPKVIWNWQGDDGIWKPYDESANAEIEKVYQKAAYNKAKAKFAITINKVKYEIDLQNIFQTSQSTSKRRKIVREDVEATGAVVEFPSTWSSDVERGEVSVVLLLSFSKEYQDISKNFKATLRGEQGVIQKIERIENPILYRQYSFAKDVLAAKRAKEISARTATLELELYHGTREDAVQHVIDNGFNRIYAGTASGKRFGAAVYFAKESRVSHYYARVNAQGEKRMFLCKVLLGLYTIGVEGLLEPPVINPMQQKQDGSL
ncbi:protein mono-ADP-ribosyltransferase PARP14-like [Oscarella lobularis]|uniref:protein mono-ADP-ribosyltransferase PARP14-like n=1 Tax=Oscarella lobularis TaxID=121494 RepID=UPI003313206B